MTSKTRNPNPVDREKLLEDCEDEQAFAVRCLHLFARNTQADINGIAAALDRNDFPEVARLAHRINGASASIRAEFLRQQASRLEQLAADEEPAATGDCFDRLRTELEHFNQYIASLSLLD